MGSFGVDLAPRLSDLDWATACCAPERGRGADRGAGDQRSRRGAVPGVSGGIDLGQGVGADPATVLRLLGPTNPHDLTARSDSNDSGQVSTTPHPRRYGPARGRRCRTSGHSFGSEGSSGSGIFAGTPIVRGPSREARVHRGYKRR
jgi:hypothetical protein